jgi:hypothetical protein
MTGNNEIVLCMPAIEEMVQQYLDREMAAKVKVCSIRLDPGIPPVMRIFIEPAEPLEAP